MTINEHNSNIIRILLNIIGTFLEQHSIVYIIGRFLSINMIMFMLYF